MKLVNIYRNYLDSFNTEASNGFSNESEYQSPEVGAEVPGFHSNLANTPKTKVEIDGQMMQAPEGYVLKPKAEKVIPKEIEGYWESFFTQKRGENCSGRKILQYELQKIGIGPDGKTPISGRGNYRVGRFGWVKQWGFGQVAYLFDFFDPSLRPLHLEEFDKIWAKFSHYPKEDSKDYKDPYNMLKEIPAELDAAAKKKITDQIAKFQARIDTDVHKLSINAVQVNEGLKENRWFFDRSLKDNAKNFVKNFDLNGDGRLSPRELILGSIYHNKGILGSDDCTMCYEDLSDKIDGIFAYIDCDNDGLVSAEEMWEHLPKLRRDTTKWNFYNLAGDATIRTAVVNDFILKNTWSVKGRVSKNEFRLGVLLGFWDRQTDDHGIVKDDSKNLKKLRWADDDVVDIGALEYIKNKAEATAKAKQSENDKRAAAERAKGTKIEIKMEGEVDPFDDRRRLR